MLPTGTIEPGAVGGAGGTLVISWNVVVVITIVDVVGKVVSVDSLHTDSLNKLFK